MFSEAPVCRLSNYLVGWGLGGGNWALLRKQWNVTVCGAAGVGRKKVGEVALRNCKIAPRPCEEAHRLRSHEGQSVTGSISATPWCRQSHSRRNDLTQTGKRPCGADAVGLPPFRMRPEALNHPGPLCSLCQFFL